MNTQDASPERDALAQQAPNGRPTSVHTQLREEIVSGALAPGAPVPEIALSARLGVSRAPIRDAILRLEAEGLVERGPRGTVVRMRTADEIFDIYQARIALEAEAAAAAAERASNLDLTRLVLLQEEATATEDKAAARRLHAEWHTVLAAASRNQTVTELLTRLALQLAPYETSSLAEGSNLAHTHDDHGAILDAIRAHDADTARQLVRSHLERTRDVRVEALLRNERETS